MNAPIARAPVTATSYPRRLIKPSSDTSASGCVGRCPRADRRSNAPPAGLAAPGVTRRDSIVQLRIPVGGRPSGVRSNRRLKGADVAAILTVLGKA